MRQILRTALSRVLAAPIAAFVGWAGLSQSAASDLKTALVTALTLAAYGLTHKALDSKLNPLDDA